jgi:O-antigen polymerase
MPTRRFLWTFLALLIYRVVLDLMGVLLLGRFFVGEFGCISPTVESVAESYLVSLGLCFLVARWRPQTDAKPSTLVQLFLLFLVIFPMLSLFGLQQRPRMFTYMVVLSFVILMFLTAKLPFPSVRRPAGGGAVWLFGAVCISFLVYGYLLGTGGLGRFALNPAHVYITRSQYIDDLPRLFAYLISWQAAIINIALCALALRRRQYAVLIVLLVAQVALAGMTGHKSYLGAVPLMLYLFWAQTRNAETRISVSSNLAMLFVGVTVCSFLIFTVTKEIMLPSIAVRRLLFTPAELHYKYFDFFSQNPKVLLSDSVFRGVFTYPYKQSVPHVIMLFYTGQDGGANAGVFADAYANFGYAGVLAFPVVLACILRGLDVVSRGVPTFASFAIVMMPAFSLTNSAFGTTMLTHGFFLAILTIWLLRRELSAQSHTRRPSGGRDYVSTICITRKSGTLGVR